MAAYASLVSLMQIIDNLQLHPRPPISLHKNQVNLLTQKITFLQEFLEVYNPNLDYTAEADPLEMRIADAAYAAEDVIETHIVDRITNDEEKISSDDDISSNDDISSDDAAEDATESHIVDSNTSDEENISSDDAAEDVTESHIVDSNTSDEENISSDDAAEDVTESHIVDSITGDEEKISSDDVFYEALEKVIEEMALIEKEAMKIKDTVGVQRQLHTNSSSSSSAAQQSRMVGADELLLEMKDKLTSDRLALQIIPIVGMGGSGKTTLARNIYQDRLILEHFRIRAWVTISQEYSIPEILQQLLKQLDQQVSQDLREGELGEMLHKHLYGRKYLIVLDDMWSIKAWDGVRMFLPNNKNGSRIVVTTRLSNLASQLPDSSSLKMNLLDEDDSWDLLSKTVFGEKDCPLELEEIGKNIGESCKGLPLSIIVVGGVLAKSEHTIEFWKHIEENINSVVNLEDDERYLKILYMSYKQLPVHLKPCFLYMGVFPEDKEIRISRLIKLWVAEGFLKPISKKSMEEIAKEYLEDLIGRNLILIHKLGVTGKIKECKIHDLLRDLCLREAEKQRFYTVVASPQRIVNAGQRRIVVSSSTSKDEAINALSSMPLARSLIWNLDHGELPPLNLMRLLRILESSYSRSDTTETCLESMHQLVNSRYIHISGFRCRQSIGRFWNLQTLYCWSWQLGERFLIWDMIQIRHIQFDMYMDLDNDQLQGDNVLGSLQTLGGLWNFKCSKEIVKRIPNIKKLTIAYSETTIDDDRYCLNNIGCLDKLESLDCYFDQGLSQINFPHSLKKLSLRISRDQCWEDILDKIGALPLLQKLKLQEGSFTEGQWETTDSEFRSLKFLSLNSCEGLQVWTTECSHFPCLERLCLKSIEELEEFPLDFAEISTLQVIEVYHCGYPAVESAKRIVEEQEELYGEETALQVQVTLREKNEALESLASSNFRVAIW